jgi:hypothetical protein
MFYVRSAGDAGLLGPSMRAAARSADANVPLYEMSPITLRIERFDLRRAAAGMLSVAFGALATLLAALGLYGIVAFTVARRTAEIGLRMALGAQPGDMLRMVVLEAARLALAGIVDWVGRRAGAQPAGRIATVRRESRRCWPVILTCAAALLASSELVARYWAPRLAPGKTRALRAAGIDPMSATARSTTK